MDQRSKTNTHPGFWGKLFPKRIPRQRIYRAFPELDAFNDGQCQDFLQRATATRARWLARWAACLMASAVVAMAVLFGMVWWIDIQNRSGGWGTMLLLELGFLVAVLVGAALPVFTAILLRDLLLRRRIEQVIRSSGACGECGYKILGIATDADFRVTCPECGHRTLVDPAVIALITGQGFDLQRPVRSTTAHRERAMLKVALWIGGLITLLIVVCLVSIWGAWQVARSDHKALLALQRARREVAGTAWLAGGAIRTPAERMAGAINAAVSRGETLIEPVFAANRNKDAFWHLVSSADIDTLLLVLPMTQSELVTYLGSSATTAEVESFSTQLCLVLDQGQFMSVLDPLADRKAGPDHGTERTPADSTNLYLGPKIHFVASAATFLTRLSQQRRDGELALRSLAARVELERLRFAEPEGWRGTTAYRQKNLIYDFAYFASIASSPAELDALSSIVDRFEQDADPKLAVELATVDLTDLYIMNATGEPYNGQIVDWFRGVLKTGSVYAELPDSTSVRQLAGDVRRLTLDWVDQPRATRGEPVSPPIPPRLGGVGRFTSMLQDWVKLIAQRREALSPVRVCLAARRFTLRTGSPPETLKSLVPSELPALPPLANSNTFYLYRRVDPATDPFGRAFILTIGRRLPSTGPNATPAESTPEDDQAQSQPPPGKVIGADELNYPSTQPRRPINGGSK